MRRFQPALLGGFFIGVVSSLPLIGSANVCCCLWVVTGGVLTVYLQRQSGDGGGRDTSEAVLGGLIAGLVGAVITVAAQALLSAVGGEALISQLESVFDQVGQVPQDVRDRVISLVSSGAYVLVMLAITLPIYAVAGMLGALLGTAILPKPKAPVSPSGPTLNT
jgi:hypothetical protein